VPPRSPLAAQTNPASSVVAMFVKICGITREDDALLAVAMGADAVGFVFAPSTRQMQPIVARDIVRRLPTEVLSVGVFRDELPARVIDICHNAGLRAAQLHGHETAEETRLVRRQVGYVIKAFPAGHPGLERIDDYGVDAVLIDSTTPGSGRVFDWSLAEGAPMNRRVILAGGLDPSNIEAAIARVRPWGVDVSSGVEASPGRKDARKVREFIERAKAAGEAFELAGNDAPDGHGGYGVSDDDELDLERPYDWMEDD
jgi:phosphoribosylanthranilate isomerase